MSECRRSGVQASNRPAGAALSESQWQRSADEEGACRRRRCRAPQQEALGAAAPVRKWDIVLEDKARAFLCPLSQKSKIFASSPIGRAKGAAAPERERDIAVESKRRRALSERPYIYNGKCCEFAGRQWKFVMFVCREAERLPYERTGDWADLPGRGAGMGDCAATIPPARHPPCHLPLHKGGFGCGLSTGGFCAASQRPLIRHGIRRAT